MIVAVALLGYAALLLTAGASGLARARWADRAPRLAVAAWLALTGSAVVSVVLGGGPWWCRPSGSAPACPRC